MVNFKMDIVSIRNDTAGCSDKIFLNSAGSSLPPRVVTQKMIEYLVQEEQVGGYETERLRSSEIDNFYVQVAAMLNCKTHNVAYAYSATDAYARALSAIPFRANDVILTTDDDYISNQIALLSLQKRFHVKVVRTKNQPNGEIDLEFMEEQIRLHHPVLIAVTHIPTNSGLVQQAEEVGGLCKKYDILYLLDACQSVGQMVVDVQKIGCDFLNATGRKFLRGPRSSGFLYVSDKVLSGDNEPLFLGCSTGYFRLLPQ